MTAGEFVRAERIALNYLEKADARAESESVQVLLAAATVVMAALVVEIRELRVEAKFYHLTEDGEQE